MKNTLEAIGMPLPQDPLDPQTALGEIDRVQSRVRVGGHWAAWCWAVVGLATAAFEIFAPPVTGGPAGHVIAFGFPLLGIAIFIFVARQPVVGRLAERLQYPITWAFAGAVVLASAFHLLARPDHVSAGLVGIGILPALPCLYGAWRLGRE